MLRRGRRRRLPKKRQSKYCGSLGVWGFRLWVVVKTCKQKIIIGNLGNTNALISFVEQTIAIGIQKNLDSTFGLVVLDETSILFEEIHFKGIVSLSRFGLGVDAWNEIVGPGSFGHGVVRLVNNIGRAGADNPSLQQLSRTVHDRCHRWQ